MANFCLTPAPLDDWFREGEARDAQQGTSGHCCGPDLDGGGGPSVAVAGPQPRVVTSFAVSGVLESVTATSARDAWAVGSTGSGAALIVHWNGTRWRRVASPVPTATLSGVAAVLHWNGIAWEVS